MPLVLVPTPLGNLRDITLRALDTLRECELIAAEDTRVARRLLAALDLPGKELWSYREQNARRVTAAILERARNGVVAVVSDAGTPGISDPGSDLVAHARAAGVDVEVLPGPSALVGAAVLSGFDLRRFLFEGFVPRGESARRNAFRQAMLGGAPSVWYESPQRIVSTLKSLASIDPQAQVFLLREYTKRYEQHIAGTPDEVATALEQPVRGEIVLVLRGSPAAEPKPGDIDAEIDALLATRCSASAAAKRLAERGLGDRNALYARVVARNAAQRERGAEQQ